MSVVNIITELDQQIAILEKAKQVLSGDRKPLPFVVKRRTVSAEGRRRMAAAQKARWARIKAMKKAA